jgi:UDP-N-acetylglucosamine 4,6-dehydratase/5-epimerase
MVLYALEHALGGEVFVPKIPSYRITDVADAIGPECQKPVVGIRPGEKLHEEMITDSDSPNTIENEHYYAIVPLLYGHTQEELIAHYCEQHNARLVEEGFRYSSGKNKDWLSVEQIRTLIRQHVDPDFES